MNIFDMLASLLIGLVVIGGVALRIKTLNTNSFFKGMKINLVASAGLAIGLCFINPEFCRKSMGALLQTPALFVAFISPAAALMAYKVVKGNYIDSAIRSTLNWPLAGGMIVLWIVANIAHVSVFVYFVTTFILIGFLHGVLGTALTGVNAAIIIAGLYHSVKGNSLPLIPDINFIFDLLSFFEIESRHWSYIILIVSALFGAADRLEWLKEKLLDA
ncbi:MAG: hypothetical protein LBI68_07980 [Azoarcus sp.]|jgi:hypothetical protein|nr:hypothetical protein [Azoarcus sp.]